MRPVRIAVVGFGRWARNYVQAARDAGNAEVVQMFSSRDEKEERVREDVDAIVYAGHPGNAFKWAVRASEADLPALLEKPAGLTLSDARAIAAVEDRLRGSFFLVGHQHLFAPAYLELRAFARGSGADELFARFCGPVERDYPARVDYGAHAVACLVGVNGPPEDVVHTALLIDPITGSWTGKQSRVRYYAGPSETRHAWVSAVAGGVRFVYDGYAETAEPPLTLEVRAFADAVRAGGTDDWRFGARCV